MAVHEIMLVPSFVIGFEDARKGLGFNPDRFRGEGDQWLYERGRQLALVHPGPLRGLDGPPGLSRAAFVAYIEARKSKIIV